LGVFDGETTFEIRRNSSNDGWVLDYACLIIRTPTISSDYYVAPPPLGDDVINTGDNPSSPLATIQMAVEMSEGSESNPVTIHLAAGTYSGYFDLGPWEILEGGWNNNFSQKWDFENNGIEPPTDYEAVVSGDLNIYRENVKVSGITITSGDGINISESSTIIENCIIKDNWIVGLKCSSSSPLIKNCVITKNRGLKVGGTGIACYNSSPIILNSIIADNFSSIGSYTYGEAISCYYSSPAIINCTITKNGIGIYSYHSSPIITNTILWGNGNPEDPEIYVYEGIPGNINPQLKPVVTNSIVQGGWPEGTNIIDADPLFIDPENGDYHLDEGSPAIDKGDNGAPNLPLKDLDGGPRIVDGDGDGAAVVDLGAYEYSCLPLPSSDAYGNIPGGDQAHKDQVAFCFDGQPGDAVIEYEAWDVSSATEVEITLNGLHMAFAPITLGQQWSFPVTIRLPQDQVKQDSTNRLVFSNAFNPPANELWGVRNISVSFVGAGDVVAPTINVTNPSSWTVWKHGQTDTSLSWVGGSGAQVRVSLFKGDQFIAPYLWWISNNGQATRSVGIPPAWGTGSGYRLKVIDSDGNVGWSGIFSINASGVYINVTNPNASTVWTHGQQLTRVLWNGASGSQVRMSIFKGDQFIAPYLWWTANDGEAVRGPAIPAEWGSGSDYRMKVIDSNGNIGWSEYFSITP
jgi:hypothetical protein